MKALVTLLVSTGFLMSAANQKRVFTGVITDTMCGADHKAMKVTPKSKCVKDCVRMSQQVKYALYDGKAVYTLSDQQAPERFAAQRVTVTGSLDETSKLIHVEKIEPSARQPGRHK